MFVTGQEAGFSAVSKRMLCSLVYSAKMYTSISGVMDDTRYMQKSVQACECGDM